MVSRSPKDYAPPSTGQLLFAPLAAGASSTQQSPIVVFQPTPPANQAQLAQLPVVPVPASVLPPPAAPPTQPAGCGISAATSNRVVGGLPARKGKSSFPPPPSSATFLIPRLAAGAYPWMAALGYYDESNRHALKFLCAGSLISSHFVITSAHCINPTLTLVRLGAQDLSRTAEPGAMDFRIRRSTVNEHFDLASIANDIALIELSTEAPSTGEWRYYHDRFSFFLSILYQLVCWFCLPIGLVLTFGCWFDTVLLFLALLAHLSLFIFFTFSCFFFTYLLNLFSLLSLVSACKSYKSQRFF